MNFMDDEIFKTHIPFHPLPPCSHYVVEPACGKSFQPCLEFHHLHQRTLAAPEKLLKSEKG